jgi:hypothetical protein
MKVYLKPVLLLIVTLFAACATAPQQEQAATEPAVSAQAPLEGVWSITEAIVTSPDGTSTTIEGQPGLYFFSDGHYSATLIETDSHQPYPERPTDEERLAAYDNFIANAGTYEISDSTLTVTILLSKNPNAMTGRPFTYDYELDDDSLALTLRAAWAPRDGEIRYRLVRLE